MGLVFCMALRLSTFFLSIAAPMALRNSSLFIFARFAGVSVSKYILNSVADISATCSIVFLFIHHDPLTPAVPSLAMRAASIYLMGIAGPFHPPASINLSTRVLLRASYVAQWWRPSCADSPSMPALRPNNSTRFVRALVALVSDIGLDSFPVPLDDLRHMMPSAGECFRYAAA